MINSPRDSFVIEDDFSMGDPNTNYDSFIINDTLGTGTGIAPTISLDNSRLKLTSGCSGVNAAPRISSLVRTVLKSGNEFVLTNDTTISAKFRMENLHPLFFPPWGITARACFGLCFGNYDFPNFDYNFSRIIGFGMYGPTGVLGIVHSAGTGTVWSFPIVNTVIGDKADFVADLCIHFDTDSQNVVIKVYLEGLNLRRFLYHTVSLTSFPLPVIDTEITLPIPGIAHAIHSISGITGVSIGTNTDPDGNLYYWYNTLLVPPNVRLYKDVALGAPDLVGHCTTPLVANPLPPYATNVVLPDNASGLGGQVGINYTPATDVQGRIRFAYPVSTQNPTAIFKPLRVKASPFFECSSFDTGPVTPEYYIDYYRLSTKRWFDADTL